MVCVIQDSNFSSFLLHYTAHTERFAVMLRNIIIRNYIQLSHFSVGVGFFVIGPSQISSFSLEIRTIVLSPCTGKNHYILLLLSDGIKEVKIYRCFGCTDTYSSEISM